MTYALTPIMFVVLVMMYVQAYWPVMAAVLCIGVAGYYYAQHKRKKRKK